MRTGPCEEPRACPNSNCSRRMVSTDRSPSAHAAADPITPAPITTTSVRSTDADAIGRRGMVPAYAGRGGVRAPGGPPGLQNRCAGESRQAGSIPVRLRYQRVWRTGHGLGSLRVAKTRRPRSGSPEPEDHVLENELSAVGDRGPALK